jgi:pyrimidine deaminase RibD-like protein
MTEPSATDGDWARLREAIDLAGACPPSPTAFSVGALIVADETVLATGYSREGSPHDHAEEVAIGKLAPHDPRLRSATIYSSLEPCSTRSSRPVSCTQHILYTGIPRIVFAWREPELFVDCVGAETLRAVGRVVIEINDLADLARAANTHLPGVRRP